jgi:DNA primase
MAAGVTFDDRIPEILERVDLDGLVVRCGGVEAKRSGGRTTYHCPHPAHEDRNPSFTVKDGRYQCWSACGVSGDAIDLLVWLKGCTKAEAIEELAGEVGLHRREAVASQLATGRGEASVSPPTNAESDLLRGWCRRRGWGRWTVEELGLSLVSDSFQRRRIRFPFRLGGQTPYSQDRAVDDKVKLRWLSPAGTRPIPYEADRLKLAQERGHVFVVEGVTDVVALVDVYTSPAVVGIPGVEAWRPAWAKAFRGLGVYVVADNDQAGRRFRERLAQDLGPVARELWQVAVPPEHNDVAAWRRGLDPERFDTELMTAVESVAGHPVEMAG